MSVNSKLLSPLHHPVFQLRNRVVMAPMNRRRTTGGIPHQSMVQYYRQRAGAGLIITDNTAIRPNGLGYLGTPGIYNEEQKKAWQKITDAVHAEGGKIVIQLVHTGRIGHPLLHEDRQPLVAPSTLRADGLIRTPGDIHLPMPAPEALTTQEVQALVEAHIEAARKAIEAGFDGVEIHGAHGFLAEQFLHPLTNQRTDPYGGSIAHRSRFLLEIMEGVAAAIGSDRTGVRLSPFAVVNELPLYPEEKDTHNYLIQALQALDIACIHLSGQWHNGQPTLTPEYLREVRQQFSNLLILAGGFTAASAEAALQEGLADLIAFGRPFIANPDLVERFRHNSPLATGDPDTFYQGGDQGYIDYPALHPTHSATPATAPTPDCCVTE